MYDSNLKARWDYENSIAFAGEQEFERGIETGRHKEAMDIGRKMKDKGVPVFEIAEFTSLSIHEIENL
jgi:hypothetical protein